MDALPKKNLNKSTSSKTKQSLLSSKLMKRNKKAAFFLSIIVIAAIAFVCGFALRSNVALMNSLGVPLDEISQASTSALSQKASTYDKLSARISEAEDILATYSFDNIDLGNATDKLLGELLKATNDPFAEYFTQERYKVFLMEKSDTQSYGVGVLFADYNGRAYAMDVLEGSEAEAKGVRQGDFVTAIDANRSHAWSTSEVISTLDKNEGESVLITWIRPISIDSTKGEEFSTSLVCGVYNQQNVSSSLDEDIGYIRISQFTANSAKLVQSAVESLTSQGAKAIVLDITNNPGGYLTQSLDVASLFVPSGILVNIKTNTGTTVRNASGSTLSSLPMVVMVNGYTTGVAEVLAAAFKDNQRATLVGQTTNGKGSVQVTRELSFGGAIRYTAAYYLTPLGQQINKVGVTPNLSVGANSSDDGQNQMLSVAMETARSLIAK